MYGYCRCLVTCTQTVSIPTPWISLTRLIVYKQRTVMFFPEIISSVIAVANYFSPKWQGKLEEFIKFVDLALGRTR